MVDRSPANARAGKSAVTVVRLMPNIGGPSTAKRRLLASVAESRLLYAAPVWSQQAAAYNVNIHA